jgi:outer membrane protein
MKRILTSSLFAVCLLLTGTSSFAAASAPASAAKSAVVSIVDSRRINSESMVSKDIRDQLMAINTSMTTKETATRDGLIKERDDLEKQKTVIAQEAYEAKYNALKKKAEGFNREAEIHRQQLNVAQGKAYQAVGNVVLPIVRRVAERKGATIVFEKSQVVWASGGMDITTEVIEALDKELPTYKITLPTEAEVLQLINEAQAQQGR